MTLTLGCGAFLPNSARVFSIAFRIAIPRSATSVGVTFGLATVSIRAAVSPKLLLN